MSRLSFKELLGFYISHLRDDVMPFWLKYTIDDEYGGILNCVSDDGRNESGKKNLWSQGRGLWTFAALFNDFDQDERWLDVARHTARFIMDHGKTADGSYAFSLNRDGSVCEPPQSVYVDAFVMYGLGEFALATGDQRAIDTCVDIFERTSPMLDANHWELPAQPHPIPQDVQSHGPLMIYALCYHDLGLVTNDQRHFARGLELADRIMAEHVNQGDRLLYEFVKPRRNGGGKIDSDAGKTYVPGHVVESMWFMDRIFSHHHREEMIPRLFEVARWHLEKGWDDEYGGLLLARRTDGGTPVWHKPDTKAWWPHTESLYALLRAHEAIGEPWCMDWYWRIHDYTFKMFPNKEHGDWRQNLTRDGKVAKPVAANLQFKDPYHLPRALLYSILVLRRLTAAAG